jgi:hypothetical protein
MAEIAKGTKTAVDLVMEQAAAELEEPEQLDLLGLPVRATVDGAPRGPGRPPGARNRRTVEFAKFLLSRYASPLEVLAQLAVSPAGELARSLGCTPLEALQEKRHAAIALAPFLHERQPIAVNLTDRKVVYLHIEVGEKPGEFGADDALTIEGTILGNQIVSSDPSDTVTREGVTRDVQATDNASELPDNEEDR